MQIYTLQGVLVISFINASRFQDTFTQLNTYWDTLAIFNQTIRVCELSIMAISFLPHVLRIAQFCSFLEGHWES